MPIEVAMPKLSDSMTEAAVIAWLCKEGDPVRQGDAIAEIETEKSTVDLEAPADGVLARILVEAGQEQVPVGTVLALIEKQASAAAQPEHGEVQGSRSAGDAAPAHVGFAGNSQMAADVGAIGEEVSAAELTGGGETAASVAGSVVVAGQQAVEEAGAGVMAAPATGIPQPRPGSNGHRENHDEVAATPLARRMAAQANLDLSTLTSSSLDGIIRKADVEAAVRGRDEPPTAARAPRGDQAVRSTRMRRTIAERMTRAKQTIPHFYLSVDCRVDSLLATRRRLNEDSPVKLSLNDFVVRAAALALRAVPAANASWTEAGAAQHEGVDIAVAVALDDGLVTPVLRDADKAGLATICAGITDLAARARAGSLAPHEYDGGTFTVSNLGMFGVATMYAIINPPQACILGVGAAEERPVVRDGRIEPGHVMTLTLSADHRVIDGAIGARLLAHIRRLLEEPARMLL
ncbi:MAG TPA: dihydrolipoamide acetyltransferase family protein [Candidatus Limnocylindrales bacterium]|nr:dihydrolipoamide acetyltransferase family protein [Candidatus Limnocylindrales bacterium]